MSDDAQVVRELQQRFRERSLALCAEQFHAVTACQGTACEDAKRRLLDCMQSRVCEVLYHNLLEC